MVDFLVIGSGVAGLRAALTLCQNGTTAVITKSKRGENNTQYAQGGIAAALHEEDSPHIHLEDTLRAGADLCHPDAVKVLVEEAPDQIQELVRLGTQFDREGDGYDFTREAAHTRYRVLHAADATGREIERALGTALMKHPVTLYENAFVTELIVQDNRCIGCKLSSGGQLKVIYAKTVLLATGGYCQAYQYNTNSRFATGDGIALGYRAGCWIQDMEFTQFHPTVWLRSAGTPFLISEAVRGEGGLLRNTHGERFMQNYHPLAELAPRDVVSRAILQEMNATGAPHVFLDCTAIRKDLAARFPTIYKTCMEEGLDIQKDWIPVTPAAHYSIGGIATDLDGRTSVPGLYAAGETADTGVHGANRLASNSLLEGVVFGYRAAMAMIEDAKNGPEVTIDETANPVNDPISEAVRDSSLTQEVDSLKLRIKEVMWRYVGIVRTREGLETGLAELTVLDRRIQSLPSASPSVYELKNLSLLAELTTKFALKRAESRGVHFRSDYPQPEPKNWLGNLKSQIQSPEIIFSPLDSRLHGNDKQDEGMTNRMRECKQDEGMQTG